MIQNLVVIESLFLKNVNSGVQLSYIRSNVSVGIRVFFTIKFSNRKSQSQQNLVLLKKPNLLKKIYSRITAKSLFDLKCFTILYFN